MIGKMEVKHFLLNNHNMKKLFTKKWIKYPFYTFTLIFAAIGFFLCTAYLAIHFRWTDQKGEVDKNSRYLADIDLKHNTAESKDSIQLENEKFETFERLAILLEYYPLNANNILQALKINNDYSEAMRMIDAVDIVADSSSSYFRAIQEYRNNKKPKTISTSTENLIPWMNTPEWDIFKFAVEKDKKTIDSVAKITGVEARLIVCCLVGEQIRIFNSDREGFKKWIGPLKVLSVESKFSFGVTGIKEHTAINIEKNLKKPTSVFYPGQEYENLLAFKTIDTAAERISRLTHFHNHFYSYLYAALYLKQIQTQWNTAGYSIDHRPEILTTLFNLGFARSNPNPSPNVGGASIKVQDKSYSFGMIGYQFYYSGELLHLFPINTQKFTSIIV